MSALLANVFIVGVPLSGTLRLLLMLPLCLSIAVVYKTTRCENLRTVPAAALLLWITIVTGMFAVGFALWVLFRIAV